MGKKIECHPDGYEVSIQNLTSYFGEGTPQYPDYTFKKLPNGPEITPDIEDADEAVAILEEGDYELTLKIHTPGKPVCEETQVIELQKPDASFNLPAEVCDESVVDLFPTNPSPGVIYEWEYQDATFIGESFSPTLNGPDGNVMVKLKVTDPYGCVDSLTQNIVVNKADFGGSVGADPTEICEGNDVILNYTQIGASNPENFDWYNKDGFLGSTTTPDLQLNSPMEGEYWVEITDENGCVDKTPNSVFINYYQSPHISPEITLSVCEGEDIELTGSFSPGSTEYQISRQKNNGGYTVVLPWTAGDIDFTDPHPDVGEYEYKIEYRDPETGCTTEEIVLNATVHELPIISMQIDDVECSPYRVRLSASADQLGTFTWSNGMSGQHIIVDHGGAYQVRFKPDNSPCEVKQTIVAPKSPDEFTWIFPTGCFDYCFNRRSEEHTS